MIVKAGLTLHDIIRKRRPLMPGEVDVVDEEANIVQEGAWRQNVRLYDSEKIASCWRPGVSGTISAITTTPL